MHFTRSASRVALVALAAIVVTATSCSGHAKSDSGAVRVVAAENFWGDVASQIGGAHVRVTSMISDPATDPHEYESDARDAAAVADARLVIQNGVGYDDFLTKLLAGTSSDQRVVLSVADVLDEKGDGVNPHLWYDVPRVPEVARAIESALAGVDPTDRASFAANLRSFDASLEPLDRLIGAIKARYPHAAVAYTERVPGYLLDAAGLTVATPPGFAQAIEDGNEPSPGDTQAMDELLTGHRIRVLIYNAQATSPVTEHVRDVARQAGIPVIPFTETQPPGERDYQSWQQHQLQALLTALAG